MAPASGHRDMKNRHQQCIVCKEWKPTSEFTAVDVCDSCLETHDKYGRKIPDTNCPNEKVQMAEMTRKEEMLLKFMETTISRINTCLINIHALQSLFINKGIITKDELCWEVRDAKEMPLVHLGKHVLDEMVQNFNVDELSAIIKKDQKIKTNKP